MEMCGYQKHTADLMAGANDKPIKDDIEMILVPAMGAFVTPNIQNKEIDKGD